jgi:hypothetical protein
LLLLIIRIVVLKILIQNKELHLCQIETWLAELISRKFSSLCWTTNNHLRIFYETYPDALDNNCITST